MIHLFLHITDNAMPKLFDLHLTNEDEVRKRDLLSCASKIDRIFLDSFYRNSKLPFPKYFIHNCII